jgi:enamine deaminase RidA (YjgF/YER057c/UK114 family)
MFEAHNPPTVMPLVGPLSWGLEARNPRRVLYISGQVGTYPDGRVADGVIEQAKLAWLNVGAILSSAGMGPRNIVRTGIYFTESVEWSEDLRREFNQGRIAFLGDHRPASTLLFVKRLMDPQWLIEIDAIAVDPA